MGYLDNTSITVDAILTLKGRELLSKGDSSFNITQFALSDDEVDYTLWNENHPLGSDYYGTIIDNMPVTEAVPDETQAMKYRLLTLDNAETTRIPIVKAAPLTLTLDAGQDANIVASTSGLNNANATYGYTAILQDSTIATIVAATGNQLADTSFMPTVSSINSGDPTSMTAVGKGAFTVIGKSTLSQNSSTTITIIANETGGSVTVALGVNAVTIATSGNTPG